MGRLSPYPLLCAVFSQLSLDVPALTFYRDVEAGHTACIKPFRISHLFGWVGKHTQTIPIARSGLLRSDSCTLPYTPAKGGPFWVNGLLPCGFNRSANTPPIFRPSSVVAPVRALIPSSHRLCSFQGSGGYRTYIGYVL